MDKIKMSFIILFFFTFCLAFNWSQSCQIGAYGYVTDPAGNPIANATVLADTSGTTTNAAGYYAVSRVQINCNGMYVRVEAEGYEAVTKYTPSGAGSYRIDFILNPLTFGTPTPATSPIPTPRATSICNCDLGDVNCDGQYNIIDALMIAQYSVGMNPPNFSICAADISNPCYYEPCYYHVDIIDALMLAQYMVGLISW